jgi:hypothetical protein
MAEPSSACPGCRLALPLSGRRFGDTPTASAECWQLYGELSARVFKHGRLQPLQQLRVDAYFAQHPGSETSDLSIAFALVGLHLALERGRTGVEVRDLHKRLGDARIAWPHPAPPDDRGDVTVLDAALAASTEECADRLHGRAASV